MANKPQIDARAVYGVIADTMPMEGRDFVLDTAYDENNKPRLAVRPLTDIGKAFAPIMAARLSATMKGSGVSVETADATAREIATVNTIRARVEQEAAQAHQARIADVERILQEKRKAQEDAAKARPAGERAPREELDLMRAVDRAVRDLRRAKIIVEKVPGIREEVNEAARAAARADAVEGRDWSVDMDAPLTSLFDRQDVETKFRQRETLITQIAERRVDIDELTSAAVASTKQYILPKTPAEGGK